MMIALDKEADKPSLMFLQYLTDSQLLFTYNKVMIRKQCTHIIQLNNSSILAQSLRFKRGK